MDSDMLRLLRRDVAATLGVDGQGVVDDVAASIRSWWREPSGYHEKVIEEVQQYFHDCFIDTSWPKCPRHPNHPMWYADGHWWCERDQVVIAELGELGSRSPVDPQR